MFHVKHHDLAPAAPLAAEYHRHLDDVQMAALGRFSDWLVEEALPAGGIGPNEIPNLVDRHVLDSLTYLQPLIDLEVTSLLDVGSGVGLPGIPLAIALPATDVVLLDRSGRRRRLAQRAVRVLGLDNVTVRQQDIATVEPGWSVVTARASLPASRLLPHLQRLAPRVGVVSGSVQTDLVVQGYRTQKIDSRYLDSARWLLIMEGS